MSGRNGDQAQVIGQKAIPNILEYGQIFVEVFDGDPRFRPAGCPAQAWLVAEALRAWVEIDAAARGSRA